MRPREVRGKRYSEKYSEEAVIVPLAVDIHYPACLPTSPPISGSPRQAALDKRTVR